MLFRKVGGPGGRSFDFAKIKNKKINLKKIIVTLKVRPPGPPSPPDPNNQSTR